jgi:hypothetical protein
VSRKTAWAARLSLAKGICEERDQVGREASDLAIVRRNAHITLAGFRTIGGITVAPGRDPPNRTCPVDNSDPDRAHGDSKAVSLSLAALAILIFGVGMDIDHHKREALCGGRSIARIAVPNGASPYVELTADGKTGPFLIDYGATRSALSADVFAGPEGSVRKAAISLPGIEEALFHLARYDLLVQPDQGQLGVIGADLLSRLTVELAPDTVVLGAEPCRPQALIARGLTPVDQTGFFASDPARTGPRRPDVPVVFLRIGEVRAFAQIDTGYEDLAYAHSVDINQALFERLVESGIKFERVGDSDVWTCDGHERWPRYRLGDRTLTIENERGTPIVQTDDFHLIVKRANGCGGIAEMAEPAAQLGASFLRLFGTTVFDPKNATVWLEGAAAKQPGAAPGSADKQ